MKFYLASTLSNAKAARDIANYLIWKGWEQTYDWTEHGAVSGDKREVLEYVASKELDGVLAASMVFLLLPGKRGSHVELGAALAARKPVIILSPSAEHLDDCGVTCSFYWHTGIADRIIEPDWFSLAAQAHRAGKKIVRKQYGRNNLLVQLE